MIMSAKVRHRPGRGWFVRVYADGKQFDEKCASESEAIAMAEEINRRSSGRSAWLRQGALPLDRCLDGWLASHGPELARSTEANARSLIRNHLSPHFGSVDLRNLSREDLIEFAHAKLESGLAPRTVETALSVVRRVCALHVEEGLLNRNPALGSGRIVARVARRFEHEPRDIDAWTRSEVKELLNVAREEEPLLLAPLTCAIHTGMRRGEILGLRWEDVGADKIRVRRALVRGHVTTPKSGRSREVPISAPLRRVLGDLRDGASDPSGDDYVFLSPRGLRWDERNFARGFDRLRKSANEQHGVRKLHFHCARHTFASWALDAGRSIKWVQTVLGHASAEITLRTYSHLMTAPEDELDFLADATPDQSRTKPDQRPPKAASAPAVNGRKRLRFDGARDQIRTGDPHVGNVMLYQLSYSCVITESVGRRGPRPAWSVGGGGWITATGRIL